MTTLSTHHRKQMQDLARLNAKVDKLTSEEQRFFHIRNEGVQPHVAKRVRDIIYASIAEEIEHMDISTPRREEDDDAMRDVEEGKFKRVNAARYGG